MAPTKERRALAKAHPPLGPSAASAVAKDGFKRTASGISGGIEHNRRKLEELDQEIAADEQGIKEYKQMIKELTVRRELIEARHKKNSDWLKDYDNGIGHFETQYANLVKEIDSVYDDAKEKHKAGINLLIRDFNYHPAFKRWNDEFYATPFVPK